MTETGGGGFLAVPAAYVVLAALAAVMLRRRSASGMDPQPTPEEEDERTLRMFGLEGDSAILETSGAQKTPGPPPQEEDPLLPDVRPTGIYVPTGDVETELEVDRECADDERRRENSAGRSSGYSGRSSRRTRRS